MDDSKLPWDGGCRCGKVRFRVTMPPLLTMACHCKGCQRMTASAFSLSAAIPAGGFSIIEGETVLGGMHGPHRHEHCSHCKSWLFTRAEGMDHFVNLRPTMLDDPGWFVPFIETYTVEKLAWASTPAVHSFERFPPFEAYAALSEDFAKRGIQPPA